jgi:hypothetical protein
MAKTRPKGKSTPGRSIMIVAGLKGSKTIDQMGRIHAYKQGYHRRVRRDIMPWEEYHKIAYPDIWGNYEDEKKKIEKKAKAKPKAKTEPKTPPKPERKKSLQVMKLEADKKDLEHELGIQVALNKRLIERVKKREAELKEARKELKKVTTDKDFIDIKRKRDQAEILRDNPDFLEI